MSAVPPGANKSGAEMLQELIEHGNFDGVQQAISVVADKEDQNEMIVAFVKPEENDPDLLFNPVGSGGSKRNAFNVSYEDGGEEMNGDHKDQSFGEEANEDVDDESEDEVAGQVAEERELMLERANADWWLVAATDINFANRIFPELQRLYERGWILAENFSLVFDLFRPIVAFLAYQQGFILPAPRLSVEDAFNQLFPELSHEATALVAWLLTIPAYEGWSEKHFSKAFRKRFSDFKVLPKCKTLVELTDRLGYREIIIKYLTQTVHFYKPVPEMHQPESGENEGDHAAESTADLLSICKPISDSEAHHVVSTVSLPTSGGRSLRSKKKVSGSGAEVGEVSVPSEQITTFTFDDTNPTPRQKRARRSYAEKMDDIPDDAPHKKPKRRLRNVAHRLADMDIPRYWKHVEKNGKATSYHPQHNTDSKGSGFLQKSKSAVGSSKAASGSSSKKPHRHLHRADLVDDSVPLYNAEEALFDFPAPASSKSKKHRSSLPANLVTEPSGQTNKILTEIRHELDRKVLFVRPRREKGAKGPAKFTSKVIIRANTQDKFGHFHKLPFEEMQEVVPRAIKMLIERLPHLKVEPPPEFQAVKSEDDNQQSASPELAAFDVANMAFFSAEDNREKSKSPKSSKSSTADLKMTLKLGSSTPQKGGHVLRSASKDLNVSIISTTTPPEKRLIYEELLEENGDKAKHYYKHYDGPKLQPHLYDNGLVHLKSVNRSAFYPFLPNDNRKFPEIPPKVPESWQYRDDKEISEVTAADFVPIDEQQNLGLITAVSQPSLPNINFNCLSVDPYELHVAGTRLEKVFCERREEIGHIQSYGHSEPFGAPADMQDIYLYPGEPVRAEYTDEDGVKQRKLLPPGCDFPTGILRPIELNSGRFSIATEASGCGLFHFDKFKAVSKLYEPDGDLRETSAFGSHLHNAKFTERSYGWAKEPAGVEEISTTKLKELQQKLSKKHPHFVLPDRKALNPEVIDKLKLKFMLDNFEKSTQTPHLTAKIPGSMIHPEQDIMMFDFSNSKTAGKFLKANNKSRKNLRSFMSVGPHSSTEWIRLRPGFFGNIFVHYGEFLLLILHRRFLKELMVCLKEDANALDDERLCDSVLFHEKIKIDPRYLVSKGLVVSYAILDSGSIASIGFNGAFMVYALTEGACEISQCLLAEGLLYFSQRVPNCNCKDDEKDPTVAEMQEFDDSMSAARYAMLWQPGPIVAPPFLCALHNSKIETEEKFDEHMKKRHLKEATRAITRSSW